MAFFIQPGFHHGRRGKRAVAEGKEAEAEAESKDIEKGESAESKTLSICPIHPRRKPNSSPGTRRFPGRPGWYQGLVRAAVSLVVL